MVYGRPALVAALDLRLTATLEPRAGGTLALDLPAIAHRVETTWEEVRAYALAVGERWRRYAASPSPGGFRELRGDDPAHLVKVALGEALAKLERRAGREGGSVPAAFRMSVDSAIPVGSGFGSSAATAIGVLGSLFAACGLPLDDPEIDVLALEVERRQHGSPSGVDGAAARYGGLLWAQKLPDGGLATERLAATSPLLSHFRVYHTGTPPEPTGAVVAAVRRAFDADPQRVDALLDRIAAATLALRVEVEAEAGAGSRTIAALRECERCLEELGVVPAPVRELVRRIEETGGAAKVSGAGSLAGPGGGSLLVFHPDPPSYSPGLSPAPAWSFLARHPCYAVRLGAEGLRRETGP